MADFDDGEYGGGDGGFDEDDSIEEDIIEEEEDDVHLKKKVTFIPCVIADFLMFTARRRYYLAPCRRR